MTGSTAGVPTARNTDLPFITGSTAAAGSSISAAGDTHSAASAEEAGFPGLLRRPPGRYEDAEGEGSPQLPVMGGSPAPSAPHRPRLCWQQQQQQPGVPDRAARPLTSVHHLGTDERRRGDGGGEPVSDSHQSGTACTAPVSSVVDVCLGEAVRLQYTLTTRAVWAVALHELRLMDTLKALR